MILVDTPVWIDFFRGRASVSPLTELIREGSVLVHPWVMGEIALGALGTRRQSVLDDLARFPRSPIVSPDELLIFIQHHDLGGIGLGLVDVQLMASALLAGIELMTGDRRLAAAWRRVAPGSRSQ